MIQELYAHLSTNVTSVNGRIFPLIMPQNTPKPAMVYTVTNNGDKQSVTGLVSTQEIRFQIDVYADTYAEVQVIQQAVKDALYTFQSYPIGLRSMDGFDSNNTLFRQIITFKIRS